MEKEQLISEMMNINFKSRLWHWYAPVAQHHTVYEQFLKQNELLTDSFVESCLGNDINLNLKEVSILNNEGITYSLEASREELKKYRDKISQAKQGFEKSKVPSADELISILDDVTESISKSLYLLKLK